MKVEFEFGEVVDEGVHRGTLIGWGYLSLQLVIKALRGCEEDRRCGRRAI